MIINDVTNTPTITIIVCPAPAPSPTAITKNKKASSSGSLMAALNLTIDSAPTKPKESAKEDLTIKITRNVIKDSKGNIFDICDFSEIT